MTDRGSQTTAGQVASVQAAKKPTLTITTTDTQLPIILSILHSYTAPSTGGGMEVRKKMEGKEAVQENSV